MNDTKIAMLSVDNTRTFEDKSLNELYVTEGELAAIETLEVMKIVKSIGGLLYNVFEAHPHGQLSLASNYKDKAIYSELTLEEVEKWTEEDNGIGPKAEFTLEELKSFLKDAKAQTLWPDHSKENTPGVDLMPPLQADQFDRTIVKGKVAWREEYSGFTNGELHKQLQEDGITTLIITGVATDYCVFETAMDARKLGYRVYVVLDAVRGVFPETTARAIETMKAAGVIITRISELQDFIASGILDKIKVL